MGNIINNTLQLASKIKTGIQNFDGLENMLTGLGIEGKDKRTGGYYKQVRYSQNQLENFHDASDIAKVVTNRIPELGTKKWITHKVDKDQGGVDLANKFVDEDERLKTKRKFAKAWKWARLYGGSGIYISVDDGLDPSEPLNVNRIRRVNSLTVLHRYELQRGSLNMDIDDPNFGLPDSYTISGRVTQGVPEIHHSRILRFEGEELSQQGFEKNDYWNDSSLTIIHDIARDYDSAYNSILHALQDFDIDILKLKDLADICASDDDDLIKSRLRLMQLSKSIMSSIVIDAEGESFEKLQRQFQNVDKMLEKADKRLQLATGLPHTILFGEGATGGLGGKGETEQNTLNDLVAGEQDKALTENLDKYGVVIMAAKQGPTNGKLLDSWSYSYNQLTEPTDKSVAEVRKLVAEADNLYFTMGALSSNEIAESRFGGDEYSMETNIDMGAREEQTETDNVPPEEAEKTLNSLTPTKEPGVQGKPTPGPVNE
jgi:phage-related protein (TIGR01555 family)